MDDDEDKCYKQCSNDPQEQAFEFLLMIEMHDLVHDETYEEQ